MKKRVMSLLLMVAVIMYLCPNMLITSVSAMGEYGGNMTGATWCWPFHGYSSTTSAFSKISSSYGYRGTGYNNFHYGMDIGEGNGTAVYAIRSGTVTVADTNPDNAEGRYVVINHNDGYMSVYMHLSSLNVYVGQTVTTSTKIGAVGGSGYGKDGYYAYHLHLGIHYSSSFSFNCNVNPCPSGYTRVGSSMQASAGGYPVGSASISYSLNGIDAPPPAPPTGLVVGVTGTKVAVSWNASQNASYYDVYLIQAPWGWDDIKYSQSVNGAYGYCEFNGVAPGDYAVFIIARPNADSVQSEWKEFSVTVQQPVDLGDNFYSYIIQTNSDLPITYDEDGFVRLRPMFGSISQLWHFIRQSNGSYIISSCKDNKLLEMYFGDTSNNNPAAVCVEDWGGNNQRWFIYSYGNGYILQSAHEPQLNRVLTTQGLTGATGMAVQTCERSNLSSQIFTIYKGDESWQDVYRNLDKSNDFFATISHKDSMLTITYDNAGFVKLQSKDDLDNQVWHFRREQNGSYTITSCKDNKLLEMYFGDTSNNNPAAVCVEDWGGNNQRWFIYFMGDNGYVFQSAHEPQLNRVLTTQGLVGKAGMAVQTCERSNLPSQIFFINKEFIITYNSNGGTGSPLSQTKFCRTPLTLSSTKPTRAGYTFKEWNTKTDGSGKSYASGSSYTSECSVTLYAQWEYIEPHIEASVHKNNISYQVTIEPFNLDSAQIFVAGYNNGKFVGVKTFDKIKSDTVIFSGNFDEFKIFAWDSMTNIKPLCTPKIIPQSEWLIE